MLAVIGLLITAIFHIKKVKGGILYGILITWGLGIICELTGIYTPDAELGAYSLLPAGIISTDFSALGKTFGQCFKIDFHAVGIFNFIVIVFSFLFVDLFDTLGTLIGVSTKANMLDENGKLPNIKPALLSDAIATSAGAILGTSTTTTFVESSSGVAVGGRTGLTACTTGVLFLLATLFSPLFTSIPSFATAPALIFVGFLMFETVTAPHLRWRESCRYNSGISLHHCHAAVLQYLRRYLSWSYLLCHSSGMHRKCKKNKSSDVCSGSLIYYEIYFLIKYF